jgi:hypothetical protein
MQIYKAINGQSIYDVCLQTYGSLDYIYKLMQDNAFAGLDDKVISGQDFVWDDSLVINQRVNAAFLSSDKLFATAIPEITITPVAVGDLKFGGIVAYLFVPGDPGYIAGEYHGLVASIGKSVGSASYGCYPPPTTIGGTVDAFGYGSANTTALLNNCATRPMAASVARNHNGGGFTDWYLPVYDELIKLYNVKSIIGGFDSAGDIYYTSAEVPQYWAWVMAFSGAGGAGAFKTQSEKNASRLIRAVRNF